MLSGRDIEKKRALVKKVTEAVCDALGAPPHKVRVILSDMPHDSYAVGGTLVIDEDKT
jgi:4-oxalocrotonate tautomerase